MLTGKALGEAIKSAVQKKIGSGAARSKAEIARHFGVKTPSIYDWFNKGSIDKSKLPELWRYFSDVVGPEHWGLQDWPVMDRVVSDPDNLRWTPPSAPIPPGWANVTPGPDIVGRIPLISWVQAGAFCGVVDLLEPGDAEQWIPVMKQYGPHAYALRVHGDSMVSPYPGMRSYPPGYIIFVDPERAITNGCRVIAKLPDTNEATFKIYAEDSGKRFLKPLNPQYPIIEMTEAMQLCGVVVGGFWEE